MIVLYDIHKLASHYFINRSKYHIESNYKHWYKSLIKRHEK